MSTLGQDACYPGQSNADNHSFAIAELSSSGSRHDLSRAGSWHVLLSIPKSDRLSDHSYDASRRLFRDIPNDPWYLTRRNSDIRENAPDVWHDRRKAGDGPRHSRNTGKPLSDGRQTADARPLQPDARE